MKVRSGVQMLVKSTLPSGVRGVGADLAFVFALAFVGASSCADTGNAVSESRVPAAAISKAAMALGVTMDTSWARQVGNLPHGYNSLHAIYYLGSFCWG